ncbi:hypothetical protein EHM69_05460 [candidate division KSB1 bacterium]|nr:MAG: hypothetical protein EHM69_05460 [candidate division KSB1 bacterium]
MKAMKPEKMVQHLSEAVRRLGYKVRTEEGNFQGGDCTLSDERIVFVNRRMSQEERAELLARFLANEDFDSLFLLPEVRAFVEKFVEKSHETDPQESSEAN